jgi:hypothetical protein
MGRPAPLIFTSDDSGVSGDGAHICLLGKLAPICCFHELLPSLVWVDGKCARLYGTSQREVTAVVIRKYSSNRKLGNNIVGEYFNKPDISVFNIAIFHVYAGSVVEVTRLLAASLRLCNSSGCQIPNGRERISSRHSPASEINMVPYIDGVHRL